jgi:hypothetical protein
MYKYERTKELSSRRNWWKGDDFLMDGLVCSAIFKE